MPTADFERLLEERGGASKDMININIIFVVVDGDDDDDGLLHFLKVLFYSLLT